MVHQEGFEPPTFRFVAEHSIQLSYWCVHSLLYFDFHKYSIENEKFLKKYCKTLKNMLYYISAEKIKGIFNKYRGVAQLVARVVWDHEVAGSIPVTSTKKCKICRRLQKYENHIKSA